MALTETNVRALADLLKDAKTGEPKACLLIGAGVSLSAGIGLADHFIERIRSEYPQLYAKACSACPDGSKPSYAQCMAALPPAKQVQLVRKDIDQAKINWAHIGIARLEREEIIDAVLTPNFDPLASRACALFNRFPAIYDLAGMRDSSSDNIDFDASYVRGSAIFHLHGQHSGFLLLNTSEKLQRQAQRIRPVLDAVMRGKPVIIAGYSGENDPLIDQIAALAPFNHRLFWVCHDEADPASNVCEKLLKLEECHIIRNMPSDKFFTELANALQLKAPGFLVNPFDHMLDILGTLRPFSDVGGGNDLLSQAKDQLQGAADTIRAARPSQGHISELMSTGQYETVWEKYAPLLPVLEDEDRHLVAWAATMLANSLADQAETQGGPEADHLFALADEKYQAAINIKPDFFEALNNWGIATNKHAELKSGHEAEILSIIAGEKFSLSLDINPDNYEALLHWGYLLTNQAMNVNAIDPDTIFTSAFSKFASAVRVKLGDLHALNGWGHALFIQSKTKEEAHADALLSLAEEKYAAAINFNSNDFQSYYNWGTVLLAKGDIKRGKNSNIYYVLAGEKFEKAIDIKPNFYQAYYNWGNSFVNQAKTKDGMDAEADFILANEKYAAAVDLKPDYHEALSNWGNALGYLGDRQGKDADAFFTAAGEKYAAAIAIRPNEQTLNNWGDMLLTQARTKHGEEADTSYSAAIGKYAAANDIQPANYKILANWGHAFLAQARYKHDGQRADLLKNAKHKLLSAEELNPGYASYNLSCLFGLENDPASAAHWLETSWENPINLPDCQHIVSDSDFCLIIDTSIFRETLIKIGCLMP